MKTKRNRGLSLLELLLVLVVIALAIGLVALMLIGGTRDRALEQETDRFVAELQRVRDTAILTGWPWGLGLFADEGRGGYQWLRRDSDGWAPASPDGTDARYLWPAELAARFTVDGEPVLLGDPPTEPLVWLMGDGEVTPFELHLHGADAVIHLRVDAMGRVQQERRVGRR